jgi:hypothetical protein
MRDALGDKDTGARRLKLSVSRIRRDRGIRLHSSTDPHRNRIGRLHSSTDPHRSRIGLRRNSIGLHRSRIGLRRSSIGLRRSSIGLHRSSIGLHLNSIGLHRNSIGLRRSSIGLRRSSIGLHRSSIGLHRRRLRHASAVAVAPAALALDSAAVKGPAAVLPMGVAALAVAEIVADSPPGTCITFSWVAFSKAAREMEIGDASLYFGTYETVFTSMIAVQAKYREASPISHYMVPGDVPAIELYVAAAKGQDAPDGIFEEGMVRGYIWGFAAEAGFSHSEPVFDERRIGAARVRHTLVRLAKERRTLWIHAYVFVRNPSMTFIAIRANDGEGQSIEDYLARLRLN